MKQLFLLLAFSFCFLTSLAQEVNTYKLDKEIKVVSITLHRSAPHLYRSKVEKKLIGLSFFRDSKKGCYVKKIYTTDDMNRANSLTIGDEMNTEQFDTIVRMIKKIDIDKINYDFNIADGISYSLSFGDGAYTVNIGTNLADENERLPELENFLKLFDYTWNLMKE
ncbi:hypothetical protein LZZ90_12130 [Flavobacterium sp. SM15]|uniref:hypothetical protein n=1 Tax=Flavobacterium sp. SM15 TaxID=2908005 RepID=UPI001EDC313B|nr:hypothetical protein [Flavobacterium sp. SM15]MCG2612254.1 hypothetical protein [Flavobacterium sp. SM15]